MLDIWRQVLDNLRGNARASVRLMLAVRGLLRKDNAYWFELERSLLHPCHYVVYCKLNHHLGVMRRVIFWAQFCDGCCDSCGVDLFGVCVATYALGRKLCGTCRVSKLITESEIYVLGLCVHTARRLLRYCWLPLCNGHKVRHYERRDLTKILV